MELINLESLEVDDEPINGSAQPNQPANDNVTHHFNSTNAKKIAFAMVIGFVVYHGILRVNFSKINHFILNFQTTFTIKTDYFCLLLRAGIDSCKWLLSDGRFHGSTLWQPYGCMMHKYNKMYALCNMKNVCFFTKLVL